MPLPQESLSSSLISAEDLSDIVITSNIPTCNSFSSLPEDFDSSIKAYVPTFLSNERVEGRLQQRFENTCRLRKETVTLHWAHGHPNNRILLLNHEAHGIPHKHLKRYILAVSCDACRAAIGKRDNKRLRSRSQKDRILQNRRKLPNLSANSLPNRNRIRFLSPLLVQTILTSSKSVQLQTL